MIGNVFETYYNYLNGVSGYAGITEIDDEDFESSSVADKNFILEFDNKGSEMGSGNTEEVDLSFSLRVIYEYPSKNTFAANEKAAWNNAGALERGLINFSNTKAHTLLIDTIEKEDMTPDFKLFVFSGRLLYNRSMAV